MRWAYKRPEFKQPPRDGDTRLRLRFALFPTYVWNEENSIVVWLEFYYSKQRYTGSDRTAGGSWEWSYVRFTKDPKPKSYDFEGGIDKKLKQAKEALKRAEEFQND